MIVSVRELLAGVSVSAHSFLRAREHSQGFVDASVYTGPFGYMAVRAGLRVRMPMWGWAWEQVQVHARS